MTHLITFISNNLARIIAGFVIFMAAWVFGGCASVSTEYYPVYKDVYIPVKCTADMPVLPVFTQNIIENNLRILQYAEELRATLDMCVK